MGTERLKELADAESDVELQDSTLQSMHVHPPKAQCFMQRMCREASLKSRVETWRLI